MLAITANDVKTKGISIIEESLNNQDEAIITVRGKPRYVVMTIEHYDHLRDCELEATLFKKVQPTMLAVCWRCNELQSHIYRCLQQKGG